INLPQGIANIQNGDIDLIQRCIQNGNRAIDFSDKMNCFREIGSHKYIQAPRVKALIDKRPEIGFGSDDEKRCIHTNKSLSWPSMGSKRDTYKYHFNSK